MSLNVIKSKCSGGMTARDRLRCMLEQRMREKLVAAQAKERNDEATRDTDFSKHSEAKTTAKKPKRSMCKLNCSIIGCHETFYRMQQVIMHLNEVHHQNLEMQQLVFSTEAEFYEWKCNVERISVCNFGHRNIQKWSSAVHSYYYCNRSGRIRRTISEQRKRHLKVQGYCKINRTCPAYIIKHVRHDGISVKYYPTHLCHSSTYEQLGHVRLSAADREWLAGKLALQIPADAILRDVRSNFDGQLTRLHLVTKQDLNNIAKSFHLDKPDRHHDDDATSVPASLCNSDGKDDSPIIAHKQHVTGHVDILPEGVNSNIALHDNLLSDQLFDRLTTICRRKYLYTKRLSKLRKRHLAGITTQSISREIVPGKEWHMQSESDGADSYTVLLANTECDCSKRCNDCTACIHRYSCTCPDNQQFFNMCKHIHYIGMLNVHKRAEETEAVVFLRNSAGSDSDPFQVDTTNGIHLRLECQAAVLVEQLSYPMRRLEERRKQLDEHLLKTSLIIKSLTTLEEMDIVDTALCSIEPKLTAVRTQKAMSSLEPNADKCEQGTKMSKKNRFLSSRHRSSAASNSTV